MDEIFVRLKVKPLQPADGGLQVELVGMLERTHACLLLYQSRSPLVAFESSTAVLRAHLPFETFAERISRRIT